MADYDALIREIPSEIRRRMSVAELTIQPAGDDGEYDVWQGARLIRSGLWEDCVRHVDWLVRDEC